MSEKLSEERIRSIRAVLFDKDGTLIDFDRTWFSISWQLAQRAAKGDELQARALLDAGGYDWLTERFRANSVIAAGTVEDIVSLWHPDLVSEQSRELIEEYDAYCVTEGARSAVAVEALHETLETLRAMGFRLGIATNDSEAGAHATAKALGIDGFFDVVIGYNTAAPWSATIFMIWRQPTQPVRDWQSAFYRATVLAKHWNPTPISCWIAWPACPNC